MDRFIDTTAILNDFSEKFKIQYGQIYSWQTTTIKHCSRKFKIQYGQIYRQRYLSY